MSWVPRFPEVKANLQLTNGEFGSLLSLGSVGNLTSLIVVGHLVHKFGARQIMQTAVFTMAVSLSFLTHSTSSFIFFIFIVLQGAAISAFHICINTQGFHFQDRTKRQVVTLLSGFWSSGALLTSILAERFHQKSALASSLRAATKRGSEASTSAKSSSRWFLTLVRSSPVVTLTA